MPEITDSQQAPMWTEADLPHREPTPERGSPEREREACLKLVNRNQLLQRTVDVDKLVEPDHPVRAVWELTGQLNLKEFTGDVALGRGVGRASCI